MPKKTKRKSKTKRPPKINHSHELHSKFLKRVAMYSAFALLTVILTVLVFYRAKGYTFTKSGEIVKRGIVLIDSAPVSSKIFLDNKEVDNTDAKLEAQEGEHNLRLEAKGYRTWQRDFTIRSQQVEWFYYPYLIPELLTPEVIQKDITPKTYSKMSTDSRVVAVSKTGIGADQLVKVDLLNLKEDDPAKITTPIAISNNLLTRQADKNYGELKFTEWSPDNDSLYLEHTFDGKKELINLRVDNPEQSLNLTNTLKATIEEAHYSSGSRLYLLSGGNLATYNPFNLAKEQDIASEVLSSQAFSDTKVVFTKKAPSGIDLYIQDDQSSPVKVTNLKTEDFRNLDYKYTVDRRSGYLAVSNSANRELQIFKNPLDATSVGKSLEPIYLATYKELQSPDIKQSLGGSPQPGSYIALQLSGSKIFTFNFDDESSLIYDLQTQSTSQQLTDQTVQKDLVVAEISWVDSQRLQARSLDGNIYYFDYDGNYLNLISSNAKNFSYFIKSKNKAIILSSGANSLDTLSQVKFKN